MDDPLIEVRGLRYRYPDGTLALDGVDFDLYPGETVAILGNNGSGKTTFLLHLNGLLEGEGSVRVCGLEVKRENWTQVRRKVGLVFQNSDEQLFMPTVLEDVAFGLLNAGLPAEAARPLAIAAIERVGMGNTLERAPHHLSAGEKKRAAIAGVLVMEPEILVFDEPTTYLDPPAQQALANLFVELPQAKILVTHDVGFARGLATRAVFFRAGKIARQGPVDELVAEFRQDQTASQPSIETGG
jgi:cobalt/nickel transport system ATP-binding protein